MVWKYFLYGFFSRSVKISGLDDRTNYKIKLYAEQISTNLFSKSIDLSFTTKTPSMNEKKICSLKRKKIL